MRVATTFFSVSYCFFILFFNSCQGQSERYDPALKVPVVDNNGTVHNYALTPLGSLLYLPWEYKIHRMNGFMVQKFLQNKEIFSKVYPYSNIQMNIVFEFQRDGSLKYWFKDDYITEVNDSLGHTILKSKDLKLRKIYATGKWLANFNDSTISIDFGINDFQLEPISARIKSLNSSQMVLEQNFILDSTSNGQLVKIQKNITTYFTHY